MTRRTRADRLLDEAIELAILLAEAPGDPELARMVDAFSARSDSHRDAWARVRSLPTSRAR